MAANFYPASRSRRPSEGDHVSRLWKNVDRAARNDNSRQPTIEDLMRRVAALERQLRWASSNLHPFKIYRLPDRFRDHDPDNNHPLDADGNDIANEVWRMFRVRTGLIFPATPAAAIQADNLDGSRADFETFLDATDEQDITVPDLCPQFWFWINVPGDGTATLMAGYAGYNPSGDDPNADLDYVGDPVTLGWANFPNADATDIPIGYVDTNTSSTIRTALIRQILRTDVLNPGGGGAGWNWRGVYNALTIYKQWDVVAKQSGGSQGIWLRITAQPFPAVAGPDPVWPLPTPTVWWPLSFGPITTSMCAAGTSEIAYWNLIPPA